MPKKCHPPYSMRCPACGGSARLIKTDIFTSTTRTKIYRCSLIECSMVFETAESLSRVIVPCQYQVGDKMDVMDLKLADSFFNLLTHTPVFLFTTKAHCQHCAEVAVAFEALSAKRREWLFLRADLDDVALREVFEAYDLRFAPSLLLINQEGIHKYEGKQDCLRMLGVVA